MCFRRLHHLRIINLMGDHINPWTYTVGYTLSPMFTRGDLSISYINNKETSIYLIAKSRENASILEKHAIQENTPIFTIYHTIEDLVQENISILIISHTTGDFIHKNI